MMIIILIYFTYKAQISIGLFSFVLMTIMTIMTIIMTIILTIIMIIMTIIITIINCTNDNYDHISKPPSL